MADTKPRHLLIIRHKGGAVALHVIEGDTHEAAVTTARTVLERGVRANLDGATAQAAELVTVADSTSLAVASFIDGLRAERQQQAIEAALKDPEQRRVLAERLKADEQPIAVPSVDAN